MAPSVSTEKRPAVRCMKTAIGDMSTGTSSDAQVVDKEQKH